MSKNKRIKKKELGVSYITSCYKAVQNKYILLLKVLV